MNFKKVIKHIITLILLISSVYLSVNTKSDLVYEMKSDLKCDINKYFDSISTYEYDVYRDILLEKLDTMDLTESNINKVRSEFYSIVKRVN